MKLKEQFWLKLTNKEKIEVKPQEYGDWLNNLTRDYLTIESKNGLKLNIMRDKILLGYIIKVPDISDEINEYEKTSYPTYIDFIFDEKEENKQYLNILNDRIERTKSLIDSREIKDNLEALKHYEYKLARLNKEKSIIENKIKENNNGR